MPNYKFLHKYLKLSMIRIYLNYKPTNGTVRKSHRTFAVSKQMKDVHSCLNPLSNERKSTFKSGNSRSV